MTHSELLAELRHLERLFEDRIVVTRVIIDPGGREVGRIQRVALPVRRDQHA